MTTRRTALAIRHVAFEDLDGFGAPIRAAGYDISYLDATRDDLKVAEHADLLVVLGGPIGAADVAGYPTMALERDLIGARLVADRPTLGVCLGAQLIALAAGGSVETGARPEIGFAPLTLTDAGQASCLAPYGEAPLAFHWHGDVIIPPADAEVLAATELCPTQAFSIGSNCIGFQFHPEFTGVAIEDWLMGHAVEVAAAGLNAADLRAQSATAGRGLDQRAATVMARWLADLSA